MEGHKEYLAFTGLIDALIPAVECKLISLEGALSVAGSAILSAQRRGEDWVIAGTPRAQALRVACCSLLELSERMEGGDNA